MKYKIYLSPAMHRQNECCYPRPDGKQCYEALENNEYIDILEPVLQRCGFDTKRGYRRTPMNNDDGDKIMRQNVAESNAWGADVHYISHTNGADGSVKGYRPIYYTGSTKGKKLAEIMVKYRKEIYPYTITLNNRTDLYELRETNAVAFYEEHVFHDNLEDATWFHTHMNEIAESAAKGLCEYFGVKYVAATPSTSDISSSTVLLRKGSKGKDVTAMQKKLIQIGYYLADGADGDFGSGTEAVVRKFQKDNSLSVDGIAGNDTLTTLDKVVPTVEKENAAIAKKLRAVKGKDFTPQPVINWAEDERNYTEKDSLSNLDDKSKNAGDDNYTKYAQEIDALGVFVSPVQGQPWCATWVTDGFINVYGVDKGLDMLCQPSSKSYAANCGDAAGYYQKAGRWYSTPQVGDQVFFKNSTYNYAHTGIVTQVTATEVTTIEGNTSSAAGVVANGGAVTKKHYPIGSSSFKGFGRPKYEEPKQEEPIKDEEEFTPYVARITAIALNVRTGPGTNYPVAMVIRNGGAYTIVAEENGFGKLKSGAGWIMLQHTEKVE